MFFTHTNFLFQTCLLMTSICKSSSLCLFGIPCFNFSTNSIADIFFFLRLFITHGPACYLISPSSGLRIAPPEAPCNGYMFGKGVYFADMFSKSANYCCATPAFTDGVLLLCEVRAHTAAVGTEITLHPAAESSPLPGRRCVHFPGRSG